MPRMPTPLFHVRLVAHRPDFVATMTPEERAIMGAHLEFLGRLLADGKLVVAGPVLDPAGVYGWCNASQPSCGHRP